jgi:hypothetical protein
MEPRPRRRPRGGARAPSERDSDGRDPDRRPALRWREPFALTRNRLRERARERARNFRTPRSCGFRARAGRCRARLPDFHPRSVAAAGALRRARGRAGATRARAGAGYRVAGPGVRSGAGRRRKATAGLPGLGAARWRVAAAPALSGVLPAGQERCRSSSRTVRVDPSRCRPREPSDGCPIPVPTGAPCAGASVGVLLPRARVERPGHTGIPGGCRGASSLPALAAMNPVERVSKSRYPLRFSFP